MTHSLTAEEISTEDIKFEIIISEISNDIIDISILKTAFLNKDFDHQIGVFLNKKELHSLIGTLLHVQAKMKGGK